MKNVIYVCVRVKLFFVDCFYLIVINYFFDEICVFEYICYVN